MGNYQLVNTFNLCVFTFNCDHSMLCGGNLSLDGLITHPTITPPYHSPPPSPLSTIPLPLTPTITPPSTPLDASSGLNEQIHFPVRSLLPCLLHQFPRPSPATDGKGCLRRQTAAAESIREQDTPHLDLSWW